VNPLILELRETPPQPVDMSPLSPPGKLVGQAPIDLATLALWSGKRRAPVTDLFAISGDDPSRLIIRNACARLERIGAGMTKGTIEVEGDAGAYLGRDMRGGRIHVRGNCSDFCASGLSAGFIQIDGNADDFVGAAVTGERQGMRGGMVLIKGNAGDRVGDRMRRGTILIEGSAGDYCCSHMIAGTVAVLGGIGNSIGVGMRRGSLLLANEPAALPATFVDAGAHNLGFLALWVRQLRTLDSLFAHLDPACQRVHRHIGDLACAGQGEVLIWVKELSQMLDTDTAKSKEF
jgi:formylmethanofuran dehydrogenase subunit C